MNVPKMWKWIVALVQLGWPVHCVADRQARDEVKRNRNRPASQTQELQSTLDVRGAECRVRSDPVHAGADVQDTINRGRETLPTCCVEPEVWTCEVRLDRTHPARNGEGVGSVLDQAAKQPLLRGFGARSHDAMQPRRRSCEQVRGELRSEKTGCAREKNIPALQEADSRLPDSRAHIVRQDSIREHLFEGIRFERLR